MYRTRQFAACYMLTMLLTVVSCGDSNKNGVDNSAYQGRIEKGGAIVKEYLIGSTVIHVPQSYSVMSSPSNLNLTAYWPGMLPSTAGTHLDHESRINVILNPDAGEFANVDRDQHIRDWLIGSQLSGPIYIERADLYAYRDKWGAPRLLLSEPLGTNVDHRHVISCLGGKGWKELRIECRVYASLTDDLSLRYRFHPDLLLDFRTLDADVRSFAASLVAE